MNGHVPPVEDLLSRAVRSAEREIDNAYRSNPLAQLDFGSAAWHYLASGEEQHIRQITQEMTAKRIASHMDRTSLADNVINNTKWPIRWLRAACASGEDIPSSYNDEAYGAAAGLSDLDLTPENWTS